MSRRSTCVPLELSDNGWATLYDRADLHVRLPACLCLYNHAMHCLLTSHYLLPSVAKQQSVDHHLVWERMGEGASSHPCRWDAEKAGANPRTGPTTNCGHTSKKGTATRQGCLSQNAMPPTCRAHRRNSGVVRGCRRFFVGPVNLLRIAVCAMIYTMICTMICIMICTMDRRGTTGRQPE